MQRIFASPVSQRQAHEPETQVEKPLREAKRSGVSTNSSKLFDAWLQKARRCGVRAVEIFAEGFR
jgi:hypothetical protein